MSDDKERDAWIASHGSERLRLALELGLADASAGVYRDERLAAELAGSGWVWAPRTIEISPAYNPSLLALRTFETVSKASPPYPVELIKFRAEGHWREAVAASPPWAPTRRAILPIGGDE